jgi:folate-binding protein YgfZ
MSDSTYICSRNETSIVGHYGYEALDLLERLTTNNLKDLKVNQAARTLFTSDKGRVIDSLFVIVNSEDNLTLISEAPQASTIINEIDRYTIIEETSLQDISKLNSHYTIYGENADQFIENVVQDSDGDILKTKISDGLIKIINDQSKNVPWYEVISDSVNERDLYSYVVSIGCQTVDALHLNSFCVDNLIPTYDREFGPHTNPLESGLGNLVDFDKGCYLGQEVISRIFNYGKLQRKLVLLESEGSVNVSDKLTVDGKQVGIVTSVTSKAKNLHRALGLVKVKYCNIGNIFHVKGEYLRIVQSVD